MSDTSEYYKIVLIWIMITLFLFIGVGGIFGHKFNHDFPVGYLASDAFQHQTRAESIYDMGNYAKEAAYISGGYDDVVGFYPPLMYYMQIIFNNFAKAELYDSGLFLTFLFYIMAASLFFLLIKDKYITILSIPLVFFALTPNLSSLFYWGHWPAITGGALLPLFIWALIKNKHPILFIISMVGLFLTHTAMWAFSMAILAFYTIWQLIKKDITLDALLRRGLYVFSSLIISGYYVNIFINTWYKFQGGFNIDTGWGNKLFTLTNFAWFIPLILMGFVYVAAINNLENKRFGPILIISLILGFSNYYGLGWRAFQFRLFWPIFLAPLAAIGILIIINHLSKYTIIIPLVMLVIIINPFSLLQSLQLQPLSQYDEISIMDRDHWEMFKWIQSNIPKDKNLLFFFNPIYGQDAILRNSKRVHYLLDPTDYNKTVMNSTFKNDFMSEQPGDIATRYPYKKGIFNFGYHFLENGGNEEKDKIRNICDFDYFVIDYNFQESLYDIQKIIITHFVEIGLRTEFINARAVILKNKFKGDMCV